MSKIFKNEPSVSVGIMSAQTIAFTFLKPYKHGEDLLEGRFEASVTPSGAISFGGNEYESIVFEASSDNAVFELEGVTIGVEFHWQRKENQRFAGNLQLLGGKDVTAVNVISVEKYLKSVISSEMSATASAELLKAHAVISRSWLLAQIGKKGNMSTEGMIETDTERLKWYDRDNHDRFDVCADDHCQRYQGVLRQSTPTVVEAVESTRGLVLTDHDGELADARFSKCCGGVFEEFENCWQPEHHHYLEARADAPDSEHFPDLTVEDNARRWIMSNPDAFCNVTDKVILSQVLNNYDFETPDFYRWKVTYAAASLAALAKKRSGIDFGLIKALVPLQRGTSGRIVRLRIEGTKRTMVIGKELEIRRTLSESHLYSSAFVPVPSEETDENGVPASFTLYGAGWGHGVGLCQIGAAAMGAKGYHYRQILTHYFPGAEITRLY